MPSSTYPPPRDQRDGDQRDGDTAPVDATFVFPFRTHDDPGPGQRWSTWWEVEPLCRGPEPRPPWVVTERGADHSDFHRSAIYTEGRRVRNTRDTRAMARGTRFGRALAAGQWAQAEWAALTQLWRLGLPVPYPVQLDGTELLMEWITAGPPDDLATAPRLAQTRPGPELLESYFEQLRVAMTTLARHGLVHGDLSAYNVLAAGDRLVVIDLPQVVDLVGNPRGPELLLRDCSNVCRWFARRGLDERVADEQALFGDLLAGSCR